MGERGVRASVSGAGGHRGRRGHLLAPRSRATRRAPTPAVMLHPMLGRDDDREAEQVAALVRQALADASQQTIAVLVRSRSHLLRHRAATAARRLALSRRRDRNAGAPQRRAGPVGIDARARFIRPTACAGSRCCARRGAGSTLADLDALAGGDRNAVLWESMRGYRARRRPDGGRAGAARTRTDRP